MATVRFLRSSIIYQLCTRGMSTEPATASVYSTKLALRTSKSDPTNHTTEDIGKLYTMPSEIKGKLFQKTVLPIFFDRFTDVFNETSIIVRQPALEIIDYMKRADYSRPIIRYALYGKYGCGKTLTLVHIMNYAYNNDFIIVYAPRIWKWLHWSREVVTSLRDKSILDLPLEAAAWLRSFESANSHLITKLDLRVSRTYEWSQREKTEEGAPLLELIKHGINRIKFGCEVIDALLNELKQHSCNNRCKVFLALDGYNGFFQTSSRLKTAERVPLVPANVSLTKSFLSFVQNDWNNGAAVLVIDDHASVKGEFNNHFPFHLLRKDGVESIDPFIPVHVPVYTPLEFHNYLDYLEEKRWLLRQDGRDEIEFVSQRNPRDINTYCAAR